MARSQTRKSSHETVALLGVSLVGLVGAGARKRLKKKEVGTS